MPACSEHSGFQSYIPYHSLVTFFSDTCNAPGFSWNKNEHSVSLLQTVWAANKSGPNNSSFSAEKDTGRGNDGETWSENCWRERERQLKELLRTREPAVSLVALAHWPSKPVRPLAYSSHLFSRIFILFFDSPSHLTMIWMWLTLVDIFVITLVY